MEELRETLKRHEGYRDRVYLDSEGKPTVGYGHHLYIGSKISKEIAERLLDIDIDEAVSDFWKLDIERIKKLNPARRRVIVNLIFNMNLQKVLQFKKMWACIDNEDWTGAKRELLDSRYHQQVGQRADELASVLERGE